LEIRYSFDRERSVATLALVGAFDLLCVDAFTEEVAAKVGTEVRRVLIDLAQLTSIDSSGIGALIVWNRRLGVSKGEIHLCRPSPGVKKLLHMLNLHTVFKIHDEIEAALEAVQ
jgi:anti-sigma B factor antagonist